MNRRLYGAWLLALALALAGCAVGNQLVTPHAQYRLYRTTRLAPTLEERLAAGNRYLHVAPEGAYAPEIQAWFKSAESEYLARAHNHLPMLRAYDQGLPDGPRIAEVRARIEELETTAGFLKGRVQRGDERVEALEASLDRAASQRKAFLGELTEWLGVLAGIRSFGQPLASLPAPVADRLGVNPASGCPLDVCAQSLSPRFAIPLPQGGLIPREAPYSIELQVSGGNLTTLRLHGRELFSRVGEALDLRPVSFSDPQARAEAIGRALAVIGNALGPTLGATSCEKPAVSPVVLDHVCDGVHVTVTAAVDPGEDDHVDFTRAPAGAP